MEAVVLRSPAPVTTADACAALGVSRASVYRRRTFLARPAAEPRPRPASHRALKTAERQVVLDLLREPRFVDLAPREVYASLLDEGIAVCRLSPDWLHEI